MEDEIDDSLPPLSTNTFAIPNESDLLVAYAAYKISPQTRNLHSEKGRSVFSEAFIENGRLGTLADLCIRALGKAGRLNLDLLAKDRVTKICIQRIANETMDINLPLEECYSVDDQRFWRRYVEANVRDLRLQLMSTEDFDWKSRGVSMKFVELLESTPVEYWPEEKMAGLALLVKSYVTELHIKHLLSLRDTSFENYLQSESASEISSSESIEISSDESSTDQGSLGEEEEEAEEPPRTSFKEDSKKKTAASKESDTKVKIGKVEQDQRATKSIMTEAQKMEMRKARQARNLRRQALREAKAASKAERDERKRKRDLAQRKKGSSNQLVEVKKKRVKKKIKNVFDIEVEPEPDDGEDEIVDDRNIEKLVRRHRRYNYPPEHCHHIDLSFVRHFDNLTTFTLQFLGPDLARDFHERHLNFSYDDMTRLARGLKTLPCLQIFRLRNSRMDEKKLQILTRTLKYLETLETVDFGHDQLGDDCGTALSSLFEQPNAIKHLELEYNELGPHVMDSLAFGLKMAQGQQLEYLGLAHNPLRNRGLESICASLVSTNQVRHLNLSAIRTTNEGALHYIGNLLLRQHESLKVLEMRSIPLSMYAGREVIRALQTNKNVIQFDIRGCGIDLEAEFEAELIIRRNKFLAQNEYIGDKTKTHEDIDAFLDTQRHPILVKVESEQKKYVECVENRPKASSSTITLEEVVEEDIFDYDKPKSIHSDKKSLGESDSDSVSEDTEPFVYDSNSFTEAEIYAQAYQPGPRNRYYYLKQHAWKK